VFYDVFKRLCDEKGVSCNRAATEMGLSNATATKWKKTGATPSGDTLSKIAVYFDVSIDDLLGNEEKPAAPKDGEPDVKEALTDMAKRAAQGALLMYDGEPLDAETQRAFEASLRVVIATLEGRRGK
jgi:transcriptional regulator with XRE-family HTH domain